MIRILHSVSNMDRAGIETMLMNYYRYMDKSKVQFDFLCNKKKPGAYDDEIKSMGGRIYHTPGLNPAKYPVYLKYMRELFQEHPEYKIVEAHNGALGVYALHAAKVSKIPVRIFHAHGASITKDWKLPIKLVCKSCLPTNMTHHFSCGVEAAKCYFGQKVVDEVQIIDYVNVKHYIINAGGWFRFYKNRETLKEWFAKVQLPNTFAKARNQEMILSKRCFNARQINELAFDCIVVGSDEVWNYRDTKGNAELKFGVGLTCKNLIAYAPSVGKTAADEVVPQYVIDGIRKFKRISARDDLTEQLVEQVTGNAPKRVLDPTFLAEFPRAELKAKRRPYILFYYCENLPKNILNQIFSYAKEHGLAVYGAGECDKRYSEVTVNLTPFEWVEMFRNAEFVFTGTFHGAVFSILNRRQFKVYLTNESRIKKVTALLSELQITNRPIKEDFCFDLESMKSEINYEKVYDVIEQNRQSSKQYLKDAIGMAKK